MATLNFFRVWADLESIRIIQGIFSFFTVLFGIFVIYFCISAYHDTKRDFRGLEFESAFIGFVVSVAIGAIVFSLANLVFNVKRFFNFVLAFGICLILVGILAIILSSICFRKLNFIDEKYNGATCKKVLITIPDKKLSDSVCKAKYLFVSDSPYLSCSNEREVIIWENGEKASKSACLNYKCCDVVKIWMSNEQLKIFLALSALALYTLLSGGLCYYLSSVPYKVRVPYKLFIDYFFTLITLILLIAGIVLLVNYFNENVTNENQEIFEQSNDYQQRPKTMDYLPSICVAANSVNSKTIDFGSHAPNDIFILAFKVVNAKFYVDPFLGYPKVKIFEDEAKLKLFPTLDQSSDYFIFEAKATDAKTFYDSNLKICPKSAQLVITLSTYIHNKSTRTTIAFKLPAEKQGKQNLKMKEASTVFLTDEEQAILNSQKEFDKVNFGTLRIQVNSLKGGAPVDFYELAIMSQSTSCKIHPNEDKYSHIHKANGNEIVLYNIPYTTITIFAMKSDYYSNCYTALVHLPNTKVNLILLEKEDFDSKVLLKWEDNTVNLTLVNSFPFNNARSCRTSFYEKECLQSSIMYRSFENVQYQTLDLNFGKKEYMIYVKEVISKSLYNNRTKKNEALNNDYSNSNAKVFYYVKELDYPLHESSFPFDYPTFAAALKDKNLAWLFGCVDANTSNEIVPIDKLWLTGMKFGNKVMKDENQEFPENTLCSDYKNSLKNK